MDPGLQYELQYRFLRNPLGHFDPAIAPPLVHYADYPIPQQNNNGFAIHQFLVDPTNPQIPLVHLLHQRIMTAMYHNEGNKEAQALNVAQATLDTMGRLLTHKVGVDVLLDDIFSSNLFGRDVNKQQFDVKIKEFVGGTVSVSAPRFHFRTIFSSGKFKRLNSHIETALLATPVLLAQIKPSALL